MVVSPSSKFSQSAGKRSKVNLGANLDKKLNDYEVAGSTNAFAQFAAGAAVVTLTGIGILSFPHTAEAEVVSTPVHESLVGPDNRFPIDLNADGTPDVNIFAFRSIDFSTSLKLLEFVWAYGAQPGNGIAVTKKELAVAGVGGEQFGSSVNFGGSALMASFAEDGGGKRRQGQWQNITSRHFLGVKFLIGGETHFGWVRFSMANAGGATLTGYAYETIANKPIIAGVGNDGKMLPATHPQHPAGSLGRLAAGAAGHSH